MKNSFFFLRPKLYLKLKKKQSIDIFCICSGFVSIGTDGARTRSFRLDRAVLWPIELQSQGKSRIAYIHILTISFKLFVFLFEIRTPNWKRRTYMYIYWYDIFMDLGFSEIDTDYS